MSRKLLITIFLLSCSCASAQNGDPDASLADARIRADAGAGDAMPTPDSGPPQPDAAPAPAKLLITEIVDATLPNGLPKFVEVSNIGGLSADLTGYSLGVYSNGNSTLLGDASRPLSGTLAAGASYVISFENADSAGNGTFFTVYGMDPDSFDFAAQINGNDVVALFLANGSGAGGAATGDGSDATTIDRYGVIGAGGSPGGGVGEAWEYTDGYASRKQGTAGPTASFDPVQWQFSGPDALDGLDASEIAALTSPASF